MNDLCPTCGFEIGDIPIMCTTHEWIVCVRNLKGRIEELEVENERLRDYYNTLLDAYVAIVRTRIDTQLIYAGCSPVAPGMLEGKRA